MINMIKADLYKMRKSITMKVVFLITLICSILMALMSYFIADGSLSDTYSGITFLFADANMTSILGSVLAAVFICSDFENKVISTEISSGTSRFTIIIGKIISYFIAIVVIMIPYAIVSIGGVISGNEFSMGQGVGFLNLLQSGQSSSLSANDILKLILVALVLIVVYLGQFIVCVPIAFKVKKPVIVVAVYYTFTIVVAQLSNLAAKSDAFNNVLSLTPYGGKYSFLTLESSGGDIVKALVVSIIFIAIIGAIAYLLFRKEEVK